jgi:protein ImuB
MLWMALHFPRLPLEVFAAAHNNAGLPLVVLEDNRVVLQNPAAEAAGIVLGTTLATAHSICPTLKHQYRNPAVELKRLHTLADTLYRFSGYVSVQVPDCVLLEIGGSLKLFGCHQQLAREARKLGQSLGHDVVARVAQTPWAAIALARSQQQNLADVPLSEAGLELACVHKNVVERFANMGIYTLGPLLNLPTKALGQRFGKALLRYLAQLTGDLPDPREAITPAADFKQTQHLLSPINDKESLHKYSGSPMCALSRTLQHWLITHQLGCESVQWQFVSHNQEQAEMTVQFANGKQNAGDFMRVSLLKLEHIELPSEVLSVGLSAQALQPWRGRSHSLFKLLDTGSSHQPMSEIIDEFNARLGEGACRSLQILQQHTPEHAWRAAKPCQPQPLPDEAKFLRQLGKRPLWLFHPPRRVQPNELNLLQGPERIQSGWWRGKTTCRDYYIAQHRLGAQCWAFVDHTEQWYLHGYFG